MLNISNIQHFSIGDGEGIRTTLFFKGCNLKCPWCHNPENLSFEPVTLHYEDVGRKEVRGKKVMIEEIVPELLEDKDFFVNSNGGITFSGGEVMLQAKEAAELAAFLKKQGVSVLIDTAGCVPYRNFKYLNSIVDGYLFDFKTADAQKYKEIGGNLDVITENLKRLLNEGVHVRVRIPLIPNFNIDKDSILQMSSALLELGVKQVDLLPFHRLGSGKYKAMNLIYSYQDKKPLSKDILIEVKKQYEEFFEVKLEV